MVTPNRQSHEVVGVHHEHFPPNQVFIDQDPVEVLVVQEHFGQDASVVRHEDQDAEGKHELHEFAVRVDGDVVFVEEESAVVVEDLVAEVVEGRFSVVLNGPEDKRKTKDQDPNGKGEYRKEKPPLWLPSE